MPPDRSEPALAEFWTAYVEGDRRGAAYAARHPIRLLRACRAIGALPRIVADPSDRPGGLAIRGTLSVRGPLRMPARIMGTAALAVPADPADHATGRRAQTLRRKMRSAERLGVTIRPVADPAERVRLLALADRTERLHPDPAYRVESPRNFDLLDHDLWLLAEDPEGTPLLLSVTPVDGELATLRYFRTLGGGPAHSAARYLMTHRLVVELSARGVRWLLDTDPPGMQKNGLRHFQRMVGFRYVRIKLKGGAAPEVAATAIVSAAFVETWWDQVALLAF